MGYRSDVGYAIAFDNVEELKKFVAINALVDGRREAMEECEVFLGQANDRPILYYSVEDIKWYPSFDTVQNHMALLEFIDQQFIEGGIVAGYTFLRLGEEDDDIQRIIGGDDSLIPWDVIGLSRFIRWEIGKPATGDSMIDIVSKL